MHLKDFSKNYQFVENLEITQRAAGSILYVIMTQYVQKPICDLPLKSRHGKWTTIVGLINEN